MNKKVLGWVTISILLIVVIIGSALRISVLGKVPAGFHVDELNAGYIGRYLFEHGTDIYGNAWPLVVNKFGDFRPVGIFWLSGLATYLFGVNEFAVRFPGAFFGVLLIPSVFLLSLTMFRSVRVALFAAVAAAVIPWHVVLSRATSEAVVGLTLWTAGLALIWSARERQYKRVLFGFLLMGSTYLLYHSFRLLTPFLFLFLWQNFPEPSVKRFALFASVCAFVLSFFLLFSSAGTGRLSQVAFWKNPTLGNTQEVLIHGEGQGNVREARIFHNKAVIYGREFVTQYLSYFSPQFLSVSGGLPDRYVIPEQGLLGFFLLPFLGIGLIRWGTDVWRRGPTRLLGLLLILAPLPAAVTYEDAPNIHRSALMMLPIIMAIACGMDTFWAWARTRWYGLLLIACIVVGFSGEMIYSYHEYFVHEKGHVSYRRNDGTRDMVLAVTDRISEYDTVYMSGYQELMLYFLFYTRNFDVAPGEFGLDDNAGKVGKFEAVPHECPSKFLEEKGLTSGHILVVDGGDCVMAPSFTQIAIFARHDSTNAFRLLEPITK